MQEEKEKWDNAAQNYQSVFELGINEYNAALLRFWQDKGMIYPGCRVIDIGCGVGKYGTYLAALGCEVTLTDISDKMIAHAKENMARFDTPWTAFACDFEDIGGDEPELKAGFDLAISTMSPAIHDVSTVRKMSRMTQGWCFAARFCQWEQPFRSSLMNAMGFHKATEREVEKDCEQLLSDIREAGYAPEFSYTDYDWADRRSIDEMAEYMYRNYFTEEENGEDLREAALAQLCKMCDEQGMITDDVKTKVMWIYWKTEGCK